MRAQRRARLLTNRRTWKQPGQMKCNDTATPPVLTHPKTPHVWPSLAPILHLYAPLLNFHL